MALYDDNTFFPGCANPKPPYFLTAYEIAVKHGFQGTEEEWLNSLTSYAMAQKAGYTGTFEQWQGILADPVPQFQIGEVATLDGGSMATASITGDKQNPVLNLGIPRGLGMADALPLGGGKMRGNVDMDGYRIKNLPTPEEEGDVTNRDYVDTVAGKAKVYVSDTQPEQKNILWFNTSGTASAADAGVMMLSLGEEGTPSAVSVAVEDEEYPVNNVEASGQTGETYDYTII